MVINKMGAWVVRRGIKKPYYQFYCNTADQYFGPKFSSYREALCSNIYAPVFDNMMFMCYGGNELDARVRDLHQGKKLWKERSKHMKPDEYLEVTDELITDSYNETYLEDTSWDLK